MKKYNIITLLIALFTIGTFTSCEDDLTPTIYGRLSAENFPQTPEDYGVLVTGIYGDFHFDNAWYRYSVDPYSRLILGEMGTEELYISWDWCNRPQRDFDFNPGYELFTQFYSKMVPSVTKATYVLALLEESTLKDEKLKNRYMAEVATCRALWMYDLEGFYGPPPVVLDKEAAKNPQQIYFPPRLTSEDYLAFLENDLKNAMKHLPITYNEANYGRLTKGAAASILMKMYMRHKKFKEAVEISDSILTYSYDLVTQFPDIWSIDNEKNKEIIFAIPAPSESHPSANLFRAHALPADWISINGAKVVAYNGYRVPWKVYDKFDKDDIRLTTLVKDYYVKQGKEIKLVDGRRTGRLRQGAIPLKYGEDPKSDGLFCGNDIVIIRYADILLLRAEALNEIHGPNQESIDLINRVRDRAFNNNENKRVSLSQFADKQSLKEYLLQERQFELCFEGERREDLIRHDKYIQFANERGITAAQPHYVRYPLPSATIIEGIYEGKKMIEQNDGY